ncbi:hypothetical protein [Streptomyces sp. NPDC053541]|uniref:hypothetical protein n=1 Tax=Streptomyces sp. NPDC053541 TaxID=3365709 RepID=UPI0037D58187
MRTSSTAVSLAALTAAWAGALAAAPAEATAGAPAAPACGAAGDKDFPLTTRIHGGPEEYPAGGEPRTWSLDLTNTTAEPCRDVHPVLVLADRDKVLQPGQIRAEFYDAGARLWRPVAFERTERAESVGVFEGPELQAAPKRPTPVVPAVPAFDGFAVPAGRTLTVPVRLAFGADAAPDEVTVSAAVVQRRGEDGDWVGESGAYRLTIAPADPGAADPDAEPATPTDPPPDPAAPVRPPSGTPDPAGTTAPGTGTADPDRPELASTGRQESAASTARNAALRLAPLAAALLATGATLIVLARRARRR